MTKFSDTERVTVPLLAIGPAPLALEPLVAAVTVESGDGRAGHDGAIVTFLGLVRNHNQGRRVQYLDYEAYPSLALKAFARISDEAYGRWPNVRIAVHHRTGRLEIGEAMFQIRLEMASFTPLVPGIDEDHLVFRSIVHTRVLDQLA